MIRLTSKQYAQLQRRLNLTDDDKEAARAERRAEHPCVSLKEFSIGRTVVVREGDAKINNSPCGSGQGERS